MLKEERALLHQTLASGVLFRVSLTFFVWSYESMFGLLFWDGLLFSIFYLVLLLFSLSLVPSFGVDGTLIFTLLVLIFVLVKRMPSIRFFLDAR